MLRIQSHPILGDPPDVEFVEISFDGRPIEARVGEPVAVALLAAGIRSLRTMDRTDDPRGIFTGVGRSIEELGIVDGEANLPLMSVRVEAGMAVETQQGLGARGENV